MSMTLIKVARLSGYSQESWSDAVGQAVLEAMRLLQPIISDEIGKPPASEVLTPVDEYHAMVSVAFIVETQGSTGMFMSAPALRGPVVSIE